MLFPRRNVKIVATVGPASRDEPTLRALLQAGVNVIRLNFPTAAMKTTRKSSPRCDG